MTTKRKRKGLYEVQIGSRTFEIEDFSNVSTESGRRVHMRYWVLYEIVNGKREFHDDYTSFKAAKSAVQNGKVFAKETDE